MIASNVQDGSYHDAIWEAVPEGVEPPYAQLRRGFLLEQLASLPAPARGQRRALDVGCGDGYFTAELARAGANAVGVDVSAEALRRASLRDPELDLRLIPAQGRWPLDDASFDLVWTGETIEHVADTVGWLSEVRRVLAPGGLLALSTPAHGRLALLALALSQRRFERHFDPRADHLRFYTSRSLRRLLEAFDFQRIEVRAVAGAPGARRLLLASARRG